MSGEEGAEERFVVAVADHQQALAVSGAQCRAWEELGVRVLAALEDRGLSRAPLPRAVEVSLVGDEAIGRVHGTFLGDPGATDVITFPYGEVGEIIISTETALRQAGEYDRSAETEVALYLIHGLLHLAGYLDGTGAGREEMAHLQEELLTQYL